MLTNTMPFIQRSQVESESNLYGQETLHFVASSGGALSCLALIFLGLCSYSPRAKSSRKFLFILLLSSVAVGAYYGGLQAFSSPPSLDPPFLGIFVISVVAGVILLVLSTRIKTGWN